MLKYSSAPVKATSVTTLEERTTEVPELGTLRYIGIVVYSKWKYLNY